VAVLNSRLVVVVLGALMFAVTGCAPKSVDQARSDASTTLAHVSTDVVDLLGLPVYPNAKPVRADGGLGAPDADGAAKMIALTTADKFEKVIRWYSKHLSPDFASSNIAYGDESMATFADDSGPNRHAVMVKRFIDEDGKMLTTITLMASSKP
jgi:hypothetical protein